MTAGGFPGVLDRRFGPMLNLREQRLGGPEPRWWLVTASLARHPVGTLFTDSPGSSAGTSLDEKQAKMRAVGEAIERYCALNAQVPFVKASLREGGFLGRWPVCAADEPCPPSFCSPDPDLPLDQVEMRRLSTGAAALAPAGFVCLGYRPPTAEPPVTLPISTGLAFHPDAVQAIWRGLCEVVERDAVLSMWWIHRPPPEIDAAGAPHLVRERISRLTERGLHVHLFDITTELNIPTVFCVLQSDRYPYLVVGAATRSDPAAACAKALDEVVSMRVAMHIQAGSAPRNASPDHDEDAHPRSLVDHAQWYASGAHNDGMNFLLTGTRPSVPYSQFAARAVDDPRDMDSLIRIAGHLETQGVTTLWSDLTTSDVAHWGTVARVVMPELLPLSPDDHIRWLGTKRLHDRAGLSAATRADFTDHPHPFA